MRTPELVIAASLLFVAGCSGNDSGNITPTTPTEQLSTEVGNEQVSDSSGGSTTESNQLDGIGQIDTSACAVATNLIPAAQQNAIGKAANLTFGPENTLYFTDDRFSSLWQYSKDAGTTALHTDAHDYRNLLGVTSNAIYLTGRQYDGEPYSLYELSLTDNTWRAVPGTEGVSVQLNAGTVVGDTVFFFVKSANAVDLWSYSQNNGVQAITTGEQLSGDTTVYNGSLLYSTLYISGYETATSRNYRYNLSTGTVELMEQLAIGDRSHLRAHGNNLSYWSGGGYAILDANGQELWTVPFAVAYHSSYAFDGNSIYSYRASESEAAARDGVYDLHKLDRNSDSTVIASAADRFGNLTLLDSGLYTVLKGTNGASLSRYTDTAGLTTLATFQDIDAKTDRQLADPLFSAADTLYFTAEDARGWSLWAVDTACHDS